MVIGANAPSSKHGSSSRKAIRRTRRSLLLQVLALIENSFLLRVTLLLYVQSVSHFQSAACFGRRLSQSRNASQAIDMSPKVKKSIVLPTPFLRVPTEVYSTVYGITTEFVPTSVLCEDADISPPPIKSAAPPLTSLSLTTIFTPPASCFGDLYRLDFSPYDIVLLPTQISGCYPSSTLAVFSPGVCPAGYAVVAGGTIDPNICSSASVKVTQYTCCPRLVNTNEMI